MTSRRTPIFAAAGVAVLAILLVFFLVLPKMRAVGEAEDALDVARNEETSLQSQLGALRQAQQAAPETQRQLAAIEDQVPSIVDLPALILQLQAAADRAAVDFFSFTPGVPVADPTGRFSTLASQITVNGGYFAVDEFLFLLETLPRAAKVTAISIATGGGGTPTTPTDPTAPTTPADPAAVLTLQMTVEFYTTDISAGPGSTPGPSDPTGPTGVTGVTGTPTGATGTTAVPSTTAPTGATP